jgi:NAD(P) transhydrogenase subunit alpha
VHLIGEPNLACLVAADASALYARNVLDFLKLIIDQEGNLSIPADDDIVTATLLCRGGQSLQKLRQAA